MCTCWCLDYMCQICSQQTGLSAMKRRNEMFYTGKWVKIEWKKADGPVSVVHCCVDRITGCRPYWCWMFKAAQLFWLYPNVLKWRKSKEQYDIERSDQSWTLVGLTKKLFFLTDSHHGAFSQSKMCILSGNHLQFFAAFLYYPQIEALQSKTLPHTVRCHRYTSNLCSR